MFRHIFNNNSYVKRQQTPRKRKKIEPLNENNDETEDVNDIIVDMGQQLSDLKQLINLTLFDEILDSIDEDISKEETRSNNNELPIFTRSNTVQHERSIQEPKVHRRQSVDVLRASRKAVLNRPYLPEVKYLPEVNIKHLESINEASIFIEPHKKMTRAQMATIKAENRMKSPCKQGNVFRKK